MTFQKLFFLPVILFFVFSLAGCVGETSSTKPTEIIVSDAPEEYERIVSLNGAITEIIFALNLSNKLVGVDITSTYPPAAHQLPKLGHVSRLSIEGILSLKPDIVLAYDELNDATVIDQLEAAGIPVKIFNKPHSFEEGQALITEIGALSNATDQAQQLVDSYKKDIEVLNAFLATADTKPKGMFIYARGAGNLSVAGDKTQLNAFLNAAGAENVFQSAFENFKPLTTESLVSADPEFILMFAHGLESLEGVDGLLAVPGIAMTTAGKQRNIIQMDAHYISSFGPRTAQAALEFARQVHKTETVTSAE